MKNIHLINHVTLSNGANLVHVYIPNFPIAISSFWSKVGSRNDPKEKEGMAHFLEHLLLTRTNSFSDRQKRLVEVEKRGFLFNAFASLETSHYYYVHPNEMLNDALNLLIDGFTSSIFETKDIEEEKQVVIDEERRNKNDPESYIWRLANSALWPNSQMGSNFYGDAKSLNKIKLKSLENFYSHFYQPQNTTFVLINSIKNIDKQISKIVNINSTNNLKSNSSEKFNKKLDIIFDQRDINYSLLSLSFITSSGLNYKDCLILELIKNYLASGWISRLISRLRVKNKLTYWVNSRGENLSDTGFFRFITSVNDEKVQDVLKIFEDEILLLKTRKIDAGILEQHKTKFKSELMRNCLNIGFLNWWYGSNLTAFGQALPPVEQYIKDIDEVSNTEIKYVANKYLSAENFSLALIGKKMTVNKIPTFQ